MLRQRSIKKKDRTTWRSLLIVWKRGYLLFLFIFTQTAASFASYPKRRVRSEITVGAPATKDGYTEVLSQSASDALDTKVVFEPVSRGWGFGAGGGGASTSTVIDTVTGTKYFVKSARNKLDMLRAEYRGVQTMEQTKTIRVPRPIAYGEYQPGKRGFAIFEYLEFVTKGGSQYELGKKLAQMHKATSPNNQYGFEIDNTIGATPQPNTWTANWTDFWITNRLDYMLKLTNNARESDATIEALRHKTRELLRGHEPKPSLLHGGTLSGHCFSAYSLSDLWGGNKGFVKDQRRVAACIFDPATYYGDRETDIAMTYLFGGFNDDFYRAYESEWSPPDGHECRRTVYNLYHILNHQVLFGGMYMNQARGMIDEILRL